MEKMESAMKNKDLIKINLDGQDLYIVPTHLFSKIYETPYIEEVRLMKHPSLDKIVRRNMEFVYNHKDLFKFSILQLPKMKGWFYVVLLKQNDELIRVFIEKITCHICGCNFYSANHMLSSEILLGIDQEIQNILLHKYPMYGKNCPVCNAKINRPSIWTEVIE